MSRHLAAVAAALLLLAACRAEDAPDPTPTPAATPEAQATLGIPPHRLEAREFDVLPGMGPHDVAPDDEGGVWFTAQRFGELGYLDPEEHSVRRIRLGQGSRPHGVIVGPDGAPWVTDGGLNAIVRVEPETAEVTTFPLPPDRPDANLNTATFDAEGRHWFTGQNGIYGVLHPDTGEIRVFDAPRGPGPYGITTTPDGDVWYASLAGNHIARVDVESGEATVVEPPTADQGARRVWSDSRGRIWVSEWRSGQVSVHDPADGSWRAWRLPGESPQTYSVYVDGHDLVWLTDFGANAIVRFDPVTGDFTVIGLPRPNTNVRQMLGRPGEVWGAGSGTDTLIRIITG